jgi:hypothetical protein
MAEKFVTLIHKVTGEKISGVHPDAVAAHEAIGYVVVTEEPKSVEPVAKAADNDTAPKSRSRKNG